jgi:hypothetical protein
MDDQPIVRFVAQREPHLGDCTIAAFAMCAGITYSEALVTIAAVAPKVLTEGASWRQLKRAAATRRIELVEKKTGFDSTTWAGGGILGVQFHDRAGDQHAVYFKRGLIFDGRTQSVWDADVYLRVNKVTVLTMLVRTT